MTISRRLVILLAALLAAYGLARLWPAMQAKPDWQGRVLSVASGDLLQVSRQGKPATVRLAEIAAPGLNQPFGPQAREFLAGLCLDKPVRVSPVATDELGRVVAWVDLLQGPNLNQALVAAGMAWQDRRRSSSPKLASLESQARAARQGLWAGARPIPPGQWGRTGPRP